MLAVRASSYTLVCSRDPADVRAAQRLRYRVFAEEMGACLPSAATGLDADEFDPYCDHLIVRDDRTGAAVGTYRLLPPDRSPRLYSESEFDLSRLDGLRGGLVELGRSCVDPEHRSGAVINLVWAGIARYLALTGHRWLAGCASIPLADGGAGAAEVWSTVRARHLSPPEYRVTPHRPWTVDGVGGVAASRAAMPPLLRGYLRLGAWVCGEPAHDPEFGVADLFVLLHLDRADPRYLKHFLGADAATVP
jgi:putative hemolysin